MDRANEEAELSLIECVECRAPITPEIDEAFGNADETLLCWNCATRRGGVFDVSKEHWVVAPDVAGLSPVSVRR